MKTALIPIVMLMTAAVWAQETAPKQQEPAQVIPAEEPDAVAQNEKTADYGGPAILSRGTPSGISRSSPLLELRPFVSINTAYDTNLANISMDSTGKVPTRGSFGADLRVGVTGQHQWRRTDLELDYRGTARHYTNNSYYDGIDQTLRLRVRHQSSARLRFEFDEEGARYSRQFSLPSFGGATYSSTISKLTSNDLFDTPSTVLATSARIIYQKSARLSFSVNGMGFTVRRRSEALAGVTGFSGGGDFAYRLSRRQTIGVDYMFTRFDYTGQFGYTEAHGAGINYAVQLNRRWELGMRLGGYRMFAKRVVDVPLDPVIAEMFGTAVGRKILDLQLYVPAWEGRLRYNSRHNDWTVSYTRSLVPGNGVYLTSSAHEARTGGTVYRTRSVAFSAGAGYTSYSAATQTLRKFSSYNGGGGVSIKLNRSFSLVSRVDGYRYSVQNTANKRTATRVSFGIAWSPGEYPLALW